MFKQKVNTSGLEITRTSNFSLYMSKNSRTKICAILRNWVGFHGLPYDILYLPLVLHFYLNLFLTLIFCFLKFCLSPLKNWYILDIYIDHIHHREFTCIWYIPLLFVPHSPNFSYLYTDLNNFLIINHTNSNYHFIICFFVFTHLVNGSYVTRRNDEVFKFSKITLLIL